jgi:hypothetical protein
MERQAGQRGADRFAPRLGCVGATVEDEAHADAGTTGIGAR